MTDRRVHWAVSWVWAAIFILCIVEAYFLFKAGWWVGGWLIEKAHPG